MYLVVMPSLQALRPNTVSINIPLPTGPALYDLH